MQFLRLLVATALFGFAAVTSAQTPVNEIPSAALVGPFDMVGDHQTYVTLHGPGAFSPSTGLPQVIVHWTFWSEDCAHLADFETCLTLNDSVVIDPSDMGGINADNSRLASRFDLSGYRGLWSAHAFETDSRCREPSDLGFRLVDMSIDGSWTIADKRTGAACGDRAQGLNTGPSGAIDVPDETFEAFDLSFFQPDTLTSSEVILFTVVEGFGDFPNEVGPPQNRIVIGARSRVYDNEEAALSLPDVTLSCALFGSLIPSPGGLIPETLMPASSGIYRLSSPRFVENDTPITGDMIWLSGVHCQQVGPFGTGARGTYLNPIDIAPTPTASPSPVPSHTPAPTPTLPQATSTPGPTPSASPAATEAAPTPSPTGVATPTTTPGPTTTPTGSPTPAPTQLGATPAPTASLFSPNPGDTPTATP